jgi:low affinity Fe/Cu permease
MFRKIAQRTAQLVGSTTAFIIAILIVVVWGLAGSYFHYSDTWQLIINTGTTILTFLMVFLIQNTQNRDSKAIHLKLDELLRATKGARNSFVELEELTDYELTMIQAEFEAIAEKYKKQK